MPKRRQMQMTADLNIAQFLKDRMNFTSNDSIVRELDGKPNGFLMGNDRLPRARSRDGIVAPGMACQTASSCSMAMGASFSREAAPGAPWPKLAASGRSLPPASGRRRVFGKAARRMLRPCFRIFEDARPTIENLPK
jgi:hypothetical protein